MQWALMDKVDNIQGRWALQREFEILRNKKMLEIRRK